MKKRNCLVGIVVAVVCVLASSAAMAQSVYVDHADGLFISGSSGDDEIIVRNWKEGHQIKGVHVEINGMDYGNWPTSERTQITVRGWEGDDVINLKRVSVRAFFLSLHPDFAVTITGDEGNDRIFGSAGNDVIYGKGGNDRIQGGRGNDVILGGDGNDRIFGGDGHDVLEGEAGAKDVIRGGCGNDKIADKDGFREINGGDGDDKIVAIIPEDWGRRRVRIFGGYDSDYMEITNNSSSRLRLTVDGDEIDGYDNEGDTVVTFGNFSNEAVFPHVETVIHN